MTTPTREQVNKLLEMIQRHFPSLPLDERYTNWKQWSEFAQAAFSFGADEARSDLEATIAEQATEISKLIAAVADHVTVRSEQRQQLAAEQAYAEQLREELDRLCSVLNDSGYTTEHSRKIIAIPHDTNALQEYGAKLFDRIIDSINSEYHRSLAHILDKIRKGEF